MVATTNEVLQYFYVSCILFVPVFCGLERTCPPHVKLQGRRGTCGSELTSLVSLACMFLGGYNTGKRSSSGGFGARSKRSSDITKDIVSNAERPYINTPLTTTIGTSLDTSFGTSLDTSFGTSQDTSLDKPAHLLDDLKAQLKEQFVSKRQAASFLVKRAMYHDQGIVCECCFYRCSIHEITDYCREDSFFFKRSLPSDAIFGKRSQPNDGTIDSDKQYLTDDVSNEKASRDHDVINGEDDERQLGNLKMVDRYSINNVLGQSSKSVKDSFHSDNH